MRLPSIFACVATLAYCWAIWWFSAFFASLVPHANGAYETTMLSVVLVAPIPEAGSLHAFHWQLLALLSLGFALRGSIQKCNDGVQSELSTVSPLLAHGFYLFAICCLHIVGFLASIVAVAHVLD